MMESEALIASLQNSPCEARDATPPCPISSVRSLASPKQQPSPSEPPAQWSEALGNGVTLDLVQIPAGEFWMGQTDDEKRELIKQVGKDEYQGWYVNELPRHQVKLASFYMGKFPVTQAQYEGVMGHNPAAEYGERFTALDKPIINVSWEDAIAFCQKLSHQTGTQYRLASEAEWEYACRAGTTTAFYFGQSITTDQANYRGTDGEYDGKIHPGYYGNGPKGIFREEITSVDAFSANAFGLYDMHGNVLEWCQDCWHSNYNDAPTDGSAWETDGDQRIRLQRGGSWSYYPRTCRSANRVKSKVDNSNNFTGFRVVCSAPNARS